MDIARVTRVRQVALIAFLLTSYLSGFQCSPIPNTMMYELSVIQDLLGAPMQGIYGSLRQLCTVIDYPQEHNQFTCFPLYADTIVTTYPSQIGGNITVTYSIGQNLSMGDVQDILGESVQNLKIQYKLLSTVETDINKTSTTAWNLCREAKKKVFEILGTPELRSVLGGNASQYRLEYSQLDSLKPYQVDKSMIMNWNLGALKKSLNGLCDLWATLEGMMGRNLHGLYPSCI